MSAPPPDFGDPERAPAPSVSNPMARRREPEKDKGGFFKSFFKSEPEVVGPAPTNQEAISKLKAAIEQSAESPFKDTGSKWSMKLMEKANEMKQDLKRVGAKIDGAIDEGLDAMKEKAEKVQGSAKESLSSLSSKMEEFTQAQEDGEAPADSEEVAAGAPGGSAAAAPPTAPVVVASSSSTARREALDRFAGSIGASVKGMTESVKESVKDIVEKVQEETGIRRENSDLREKRREIMAQIVQGFHLQSGNTHSHMILAVNIDGFCLIHHQVMNRAVSNG
jgi:hypothetical protein